MSSNNALGLFLAAFALSCLLVLYRNRRSITALVTDRTSAVFVFVVGFLLSFPTAFSAFTNSRSIAVNEYGLSRSGAKIEPAVLQPYIEILISVFCFVVILRQVLGSRSPIVLGPRAFGALTIGLISIIGSLYAAERVLSLANVSFILVLVAACFLSGGRSALYGGLGFIVYVSVVSGLLAGVYPSQVLVACERKCSIFGSVYYGIFLNENAIGLVISVGLALAVVCLQGASRLTVASFLMVSVVATGSRTSVVAAVVSAIVIVLLLRCTQDVRLPSFRFTRSLVMIAALCWPAVLLVSAFSDQLTGRPILWAIAVRYFAANPVTGWGAKRWSTISNGGVFDAAARYSAHNQFYDIAFVAGSVALVIFYYLIYSALYSKDEHASVGSLYLMLPVVIIGFTERPMAVGSLDWLSFLYLMLILVVPFTAHKSGYTDIGAMSRKASVAI